MPDINRSTILREITVPSVDTDGSLENSRQGVRLANDSANPGANKVYGTDADGNKGWQDRFDPSSLTEDQAYTLWQNYFQYFAVGQTPPLPKS